jgi:hypothetical protein
VVSWEWFFDEPQQKEWNDAARVSKIIFYITKPSGDL